MPGCYAELCPPAVLQFGCPRPLVPHSLYGKFNADLASTCLLCLAAFLLYAQGQASNQLRFYTCSLFSRQSRRVATPWCDALCGALSLSAQLHCPLHITFHCRLHITLHCRLHITNGVQGRRSKAGGRVKLQPSSYVPCLGCAAPVCGLGTPTLCQV